MKGMHAPHTDITMQDHKINLLSRVESILPRWSAWFQDLVGHLHNFDAWRSLAPPELAPAAHALELELNNLLEACVNHLHDLWCLHTWLIMDDEVTSGHEALLIEVVVDLMQRCGRVLSHENVPFLPSAEHQEVPFDAWIGLLEHCSFGRSLVLIDSGMSDLSPNGRDGKAPDVPVEATGQLGPPPAPLPTFPQHPSLNPFIDDLQTMHDEARANHARKRFYNHLRERARASPFSPCRLSLAQCWAALTECEANHVNSRTNGRA